MAGNQSGSGGSILAWVLGGSTAVLLFLVLLVAVFGGGLDDTLRARASAELKNYKQAGRQFSSLRANIEQILSEEPKLFSAQSLDAVWKDRLNQAASELSKTETTATQLQMLLEENDSEKSNAVGAASSKLTAARIAALSEATEIHNAAKRLVTFKREVKQNVAQMAKEVAAIQQVDLQPVQAKVEQAVADWPDKKSDLEKRLASLVNAREEATELWEATSATRRQVEEDTSQLTDQNVVQLAQAATRLGEIRKLLGSGPTQVAALIDQLYWSWDKTLVDMEIREGLDVTFRQKFETVRIRAQLEETPEEPAERKKSEAWETVNKAEFEQLKDKLGMVVAHKDAGKYDHEATDLVQPPGYAYMCPPDQHRNRYGYWHTAHGRSMWRYHNHYGFMPGLWGMGRHRVTGGMYNGYSSSLRSGSTFFGSGPSGMPLYGSDGTTTRQHYASSRYVQTNGFKNTRYVQSGGKYRGSRYQQSRSYRSSSYRSSSRSSGSRSFFGGK